MIRSLRRAVLLPLAFLLVQVPLLAPACSGSGDNPMPDGGTGTGAGGAHDAGQTSSSTTGTGGEGGSADAGADVLVPPPIDRTQTEAQLAPQRQACAFTAGAWPAQTIGTDYPVGADIPINHVIVIVQENRSFDHYLGRLVAQGYYQPGDFSVNDAGIGPSDGGETGSGFSHHDQLDGPPPGWGNYDTDGTFVVPHPDTEYCYGVNHGWTPMHDQYDNGLLDHFVTNNDPNGQRAFYYEDDTVIPFYYALASTFAVGDRYFCSVPSSTWPNRFYVMAATSFGIGDNSFDNMDTAAHPSPQIFSLLESGGHTWKDYTDGPHMLAFFPWFAWQPDTLHHFGNIECDLLGDIKNGTLPDVSYVMGDEVDQDSDEGPSDLPGIGGQLVETIVRTLFASKSWKDTAVFITYDENGGLADHVAPAPACPPDNLPPVDKNGNPLPGDFGMTGFRVPFIVVSPYTRAHYVSHTHMDHTSIVRFIEARFGLPALTARDANATPPMEMFDFKSPPFMAPPTITATTTVPQQILTQCNQTLAPLTCGAP
jgi:phospholipase C